MNMLKSDDSIFILAQSHIKTLKIKIIDGQIVLEEINKTHIFSQKNTVSKVNKGGSISESIFILIPLSKKIFFRLISFVEDSDFAQFFLKMEPK